MVADAGEAELHSSGSTVSSLMARAAARLRQARDTIAMQSKELAKIAQLKSSLKNLENNMSFYEASEEDLKNAFAATIKDSTWFSQLVDGIQARLADLRVWLSAKVDITRFIVKDSYASLSPSLRSLVEYFCVGPNRSVNEAIGMGSIVRQPHAEAVIDCITLCFSEGAA